MMKKLISFIVAFALLTQVSFGSGFNYNDNWNPSITAFTPTRVTPKTINISATPIFGTQSMKSMSPKIQPSAGFATLAATIVLASCGLALVLPVFWGGVVIFNASYYGKGDFYFGDPNKKSIAIKGSLKSAPKTKISMMKSLSKTGSMRTSAFKNKFGFKSLNMGRMNIRF